MAWVHFENFINYYSFDLESNGVRSFLRTNLYEIFLRCHFPVVSMVCAGKDLYRYINEDEIKSVAVIARLSISLVGLGPMLFLVDVVGTLFKVIYRIGEQNKDIFSKGRRKLIPSKS